MKARPAEDLERPRQGGAEPLTTPGDLGPDAAREVGGALKRLLDDSFAVYLKTKNLSLARGRTALPRLPLLPDEQADEIFAMTDPIAERGSSTLRSIGEVAKTQRVLDNKAAYVEPSDMLADLREENATLASASLLEVWIDEAERRSSLLHEQMQQSHAAGR